MRDFIGVNVKAQYAYERMKKIGFARNFQLWADDQSNYIGTVEECPLPIPANSGVPKLRWNPSYNTNRYIRYDDFYKFHPQRTVAVIQGSAPVMYKNSAELFAKPICPQFYLPAVIDDADFHAEPDNWQAMAIRASLFAARYGAAPSGGFPTNFLQEAADYVEYPDYLGFGQASVKYMEIFNEPDAAWNAVDHIDTQVTGTAMEKDPAYLTKYYFRPDQYAAMLSAVYDGNKGSGIFEGTHWGIHNLSPDTKVVLAGTSDLRIDYLHYMRVAWDDMRGAGNYPFDIVNYHFYSTTDHPTIGQNPKWDQFYRGRQFFGNGQGAFPESGNVDLRGRIKKVLDDRQQNQLNIPSLFADKPTWITEFGYDTQGATAVGLESFCGFDEQTIQGQWITRYFMEASAARGGGQWVDKVFMYELGDDLDRGDGLFGHCGLLETDATPKKSWYHLLTLKSVLDATRFSKTNSDYQVAFMDNSGDVLPFDDPRMYQYTHRADEKPTIAAWVPHGKDLACDQNQYHGAVLIKKFTNDPFEPKPVVQAIEVLDYDEDGLRTLIDPSLIDEVSATPPGSGSARNYWRINGIRLGDTEISLTETPIYFRVSQPMLGSDKVVVPVLNLNAACMSCNTVRLTWDIPTGQLYSYYAVYYQKIACGAISPVFDPHAATLLTDRLPGLSKDAVIPGLNWSPGECYIFWVLPFVYNMNGWTSSFFTYSQPDMTQPLPTRHFFVWEPATCAACAASFDQQQVTITQNPWGSGSFLEGQFFESLLPSDPSVICSDLTNNPAPNNFGLFVDPGKTLQFVIDFDGTKYIDALYLYYVSGTGRVTIEYMSDCCQQYTKLMPIDINDHSIGGNNIWLRVVNTVFNKERIEKIRITIEGLADIGIVFKRMYMCTHPAPDACPGDQFKNEGEGELLTPVSDLVVKDIDTRSAVVGWNAARRFVDNVETFPISKYTVQYSIARGQNGTLVEPVSLEYEGAEWGGDNELPLSPLAPNTTYFVDIFPSIAANPCVYARPVAKTSFTTLAVESQNRSSNKAEQLSTVSIFPNPATDKINVQTVPGTFLRYRITHVNGVMVQEGILLADKAEQAILLKGFANGMYILSMTGPNTQMFSKAFIISR